MPLSNKGAHRAPPKQLFFDVATIIIEKRIAPWMTPNERDIYYDFFKKYGEWYNKDGHKVREWKTEMNFVERSNANSNYTPKNE